jgi:phenylpropionate dioxygenase-like ring-hydroxylating dioxygenase large terminal subunit
MDEVIEGKTIKQPVSIEWLARESRKASLPFGSRSDPATGTDDIEIARYATQTFHDLEVQHLWPRTWQMVCHESELPDVGSYLTYEIGSQSWIIVRAQENEVKAYANSCLHRGMALTEGRGKKLAFTCTFHGWSWNLDGTPNRITEDWDFPQCSHQEMDLPQAKVGHWGGCIHQT